MGYSKLTARFLLTTLLVVPPTLHAEFFVSKGTSGELGYSYRLSRDNSGNSLTNQMVTGRITTDGYIWQPWFVTAGISLSVTQDRASSENGTASDSNFLTGELNVTALPMSRFPFSVRYSANDSRVDSSSANDNPLLSQSLARQFHRTNLQVSQGYYGELYRLNFRYNSDETKSDLGEFYRQEGYAADYALRGRKQNLTANALFQTQENNQNSNVSDNTVVAINHNYYPSSSTTLDTVASHVKSNNFYTSAFAGLTQQLTSNIDQASTTVGWRSESNALRVNGGLRVHHMDYMTDNGLAVTSLNNDGLSSSVGASYQFSERLSGSLSGQYSEIRNQLENDTALQRSFGEAAQLSYSSARSEYYGYDYGWNSALSGTVQQSGESKSSAAGLTLGHGAGRSWRLESRDSVRLSFNQDLSEGYSHSSGPATTSYTGGMQGETRRIGHGVSLGWSRNDQEGSSMAQLTLSDARGIIGDRSVAQMANLQLSRSQILDGRSTLNGNLSWQAWHYTLPGIADYGVGQTTTASASYQYARPFTLQRVTFVSDLRMSDNQPALGPAVQETFWDNRFTHEIGMMRSSLGLTYRDYQGLCSTMLMFSVRRLF